MANIKKGQLANIVFPMVDGVDFATVESGLTASDFESKVTKKFFGVNHGGSAAFTSGTISKTIALVRSGLFQQTLKTTETNYDYLLYAFIPSNTSLAEQILIFETETYDDSDIYSQLSDIGSNLLSYLTGMSGMLSDVDSQVLLNASVISDIESQIDSGVTVGVSSISDIGSRVWSNIIGASLASRVLVIQSMLSDADSQVLLNASVISDIQSALSDAHSDLGSQIGAIAVTVTASDMSDISSRVWATTEGTRVDSRILVGQSLLSDIDSQVLLNASVISDIQSALSDAHSDLGSQIGAIAVTVTASDMSDISSRVWATAEGTRVDSRILVLQSNLSDVDSQLLIDSSRISDLQSALSDAHSDLGSKIGNVSVTLTASDISDIASAVTAAGVNLTASDMSDISSRVWATAEGTRVDSRILVLQSNLSDVDSQLLIDSSRISDLQSALSDAHSDLGSQIGAIAVTVTASDMSDISSRVWATAEGTRVDSRILVLQSNLSDVDSQLLIDSSRISDVYSLLSDLDSDIMSRIPEEPAARSQLSDLHSDLRSLVDNVDSQVLVDASRVSDIYSLLSDVSSDIGEMSGIQSDIYSNLQAGVTVGASSISDIESRILYNALTESYAADGAAGTLAQLAYAIQQFLQERDVAGTTLTVKKLDGTTTAMTFTLDDTSQPTSLTRAT